MIAYLEGTVRSVGGDSIVLLVGGVGYHVYTVGVAVQVGDNLALDVFDYVREDRRELYGFADSSMQALFLKMIDISGVGTRLAQKVLNAVSYEQMMQHISGGSVDSLTTIPGVGKKTAQKLILELKGVLVVDEEVEDTDVLDALLSLGYSRKDAVEVLKEVVGESVEQRIKHALQLLSV